MTGLSRHGKRLISECIDTHLDDFDATPIHNQIYDVDDGDELVLELALAAERTYYANAEAYNEWGHDTNETIRSATDDAYETLRDALQTRIDDLVAEACAECLDNGYEWHGLHYDDEEIEQSKAEARAWLDSHAEIAERAGVQEVVEA